MMKIWGGALIVSGGYLLGWVRVRQWKKRLKLLEEIYLLFEAYLQELRQYRRSLKEFFAEKGELAGKIFSGEMISGLLNEDQKRIQNVISQLKNSSFQKSIDVCDEYIREIGNTIKKMQEDTASQGKALPLVTGAIGFLVAVLLY